MLRTPLEQQLNGFGEWEFISLLGEVLRGEAKDVLASFLDKWDFENEENENWEADGKFGENTAVIVRPSNPSGRDRPTTRNQSNHGKMSHEILIDSSSSYKLVSDLLPRRTYP